MKGQAKMIRFNEGDSLIFKKKHPCGSFEFTVLRTGSDVRVMCKGCGRDMTHKREKIEKMIKKVCTKETREEI